MAIIGIGIDLIKINRLKKIVLYKEQQFIKKILTKYEQQEYKKFNKQKEKIISLAKFFIVKEATAKALGTGMRNGVTFTQIELRKNILGKPSISLLKKAKLIANNLKVTKLHVTLTDDLFYASCLVILENII